MTKKNPHYYGANSIIYASPKGKASWRQVYGEHKEPRQDPVEERLAASREIHDMNKRDARKLAKRRRESRKVQRRRGQTAASPS